jgi:ybaK/ebsC protein
MKQAARVSGNKSVELIAVKDLLPLTGYLRGGCSPLGMKKAFPTYFDDSITSIRMVYVSAGLRGMQVKVNPQALVDVVGGTIAPLTMG